MLLAGAGLTLAAAVVGLVAGVAAATPTPGSGEPSPVVVPTPPPCVEPLQAIVDGAAVGATVVLPACTSREMLVISQAVTIEAHGTVIDGEGQLEHAVLVEADDVAIVGLSVTDVDNPVQDGAVRAWDVDRFRFAEGLIADSAGACISVARGSDAVIERTTLAGCAQEGFHATRADRLVIRDSVIRDNNAAGTYDPEWEAGGGKITVSRDVLLEGNDVFGNLGPGLWCDIDCVDLTARANRVWSNDRAGIMFEISDGAIIEGNRVWENGWGKQTWGWGAGILVSSSRNALVRDNVVAWNADGIVIVSQGRDDRPGPSVGNRTEDNVVAMHVGADAFGLGWLQDWAGGLHDAAAGNGGDGDAFWFDRDEGQDARFAWDRPFRRLDEFAATPGGTGATYLATEVVKATLEAAGMPSEAAAEHPISLPSLRELVIPLVVGAVAVLGLGILVIIGLVLVRRRRRSGPPDPTRQP